MSVINFLKTILKNKVLTGLTALKGNRNEKFCCTLFWKKKQTQTKVLGSGKILVLKKSG